MPTTREPFGSVDPARLQGLQSAKNFQNSLQTTRSGKRALQDITNSVNDTENIDPALSTKSTKRVKAVDGSSHASKTKSQFFLSNAPPSPQDVALPVKSSVLTGSTRHMKVPSSRMKKTKSLGRPGLKDEGKVNPGTPFTNTTPAGRSPKSKRVGLLNTRRLTGSPYTRVNPPAALSGAATPSIDAALSATMLPQQESPIETLSEKPKPKGWFFDVREDTLDESLTIIMSHSTGTLDISDDESSRKAKNDRGKENIPPADFPATESSIALTPSTSVATSQIRERSACPKKSSRNPFYRAPLGDLAVSEFYDEEATFVPSTACPDQTLARKEKTVPEQWPVSELTFKGFGTGDAEGQEI
ncbi:MAG: hypothetical protein M1837_004169 [Sclerophora amabilis]|nr:MAG: hypothetical protein M1837_004169 [Sclerophora amabilis]